jgi:hypothetical protein
MAGKKGKSGGIRKGAGRPQSKLTIRDGQAVTLLDHLTKRGGKGVARIERGVIVIVLGGDAKNPISIILESGKQKRRS